MITIENPNHEKIYHLLTTKKSRDSIISGEEWKSKKVNTLEDSDINLMLSNGPIELIEPLEQITQTYLRNGDYYNSFIEIHARNPDCFKESHDLFREKMSQKQVVFIPSTRNLTGYLLKKGSKEKPFACIMASEDGLVRAIGIAQFGAKKERIDDLDGFIINLGMLNSYTNTLLESVYEGSMFIVCYEETPKIKLEFPAI